MKDPNELSEREQEILRLVARGKSNKEIALAVFLSVNTVHTHMRNIFRKINVSSRTEATLFAIENRIIQSPGAEALPPVETIAPPTEPAKPGFLKRYWWLVGILGLGLIAGVLFLSFPNIFRKPASQSTEQPGEQLQQLSPLPEGRTDLAMIGYNNFLYAIGGKSAKGISGRTDRYNPQENAWETLADKPTPVSAISAAILGDLIYIPGGLGIDEIPVKLLEVYNPLKDTWQVASSLPIPISGYALIAYEGRLFLFGGSDGSQTLSNGYIYDPSKNTWSETSPMPTPREFAGIAIAGGKIYVVGGLNETGESDACEVYTPSRENSEVSPWEDCPRLPAGRYHFGLVSLVETLYLDGGIGDGLDLPALSFSPFGEATWQVRNTPNGIYGKTLSTSFGGLIYLVNELGNSEPTLFVYQPGFNVFLPLIK